MTRNGRGRYNKKAVVDSIKKAYCWYKTPEFKDIMHAIDQLNYAIPDQREEIKRLIKLVSKGNGYEPFTTINRFPRQQCFIYLGAPDYIEVLQELNRLLQQSDAPIPHTLPPVVTLRLDAQDPLTEFSKQLAKLKMLVASNTHVYTRETFESSFDLKWS